MSSRIILYLPLLVVFSWVACSSVRAERGVEIPVTHVDMFRSLLQWQGKTYENGDDCVFVAGIYLENRRYLPKYHNVLLEQFAGGKLGFEVFPADGLLPGDIHVFRLSRSRPLLLGIHLACDRFLAVDSSRQVRMIRLDEGRWTDALLATWRVIEVVPDQTGVVFVPFEHGDCDRASSAATSGTSPDAGTQWWFGPPEYVAALLAILVALVILVPMSRGGRSSGKPAEAPGAPPPDPSESALLAPPPTEHT